MKRVFGTLLREVSLEQNGLLQTRMTSWWDGKTLLFEGEIARRGHVSHPFHEPERAAHLCRPASRADALRHAVRVHDAFLVHVRTLPPVDPKEHPYSDEAPCPTCAGTGDAKSKHARQGTYELLEVP